jgi:hypothetical protein
MSEINILREELDKIPNMDIENIVSIVKSYTEIDYYKSINRPLHLELEYNFDGYSEEYNVILIENRFYIVENINCYVENRVGVKNGKYYKFDKRKNNCDCEIHANSTVKCHLSFKDYELKPKNEGYFYIECLDNLKHIYEPNDFEYFLYERKIVKETTLNEIKSIIQIFEEWYSSCKETMYDDDNDEDGRIYECHRNKNIIFNTFNFPCHNMNGEMLFTLFNSTYNKFHTD